jgi:hypothetical protein
MRFPWLAYFSLKNGYATRKWIGQTPNSNYHYTTFFSGKHFQRSLSLWLLTF